MRPQVIPGMCEPDPVAFGGRRVHESYEIGSIPTAAPEAAEGREGSFRLPARSGGRSQTAAPGELAVQPGGTGASMCPPVPTADRSRSIPPHSSQSSRPGTSSALPAATSSRIRCPATAAGPVRPTRLSAA